MTETLSHDSAFLKTESSNKELPVMRIDACLAILMHIHLQAFQWQAQLSKVQQGPPVQVRRDTAVVIMAVPAHRELRHGESGSRRAESLVGSLYLRVAQPRPDRRSGEHHFLHPQKWLTGSSDCVLDTSGAFGWCHGR